MKYIKKEMTYYPGLKGEWVIVDMDYYSYSSKEELMTSFEGRRSYMKSEGYSVTIEGNTVTYTSPEKKVVIEYYECKQVWIE